MVLGSVVAVFGVIMMSMTMPIMVSNFNSLYINSVVGQPSAARCMDTKNEGATTSGDLLRRRADMSVLKDAKMAGNGVWMSSQMEDADKGQCCRSWCCRRRTKEPSTDQVQPGPASSSLPSHPTFREKIASAG